jgi:hypothetical protein
MSTPWVHKWKKNEEKDGKEEQRVRGGSKKQDCAHFDKYP